MEYDEVRKTEAKQLGVHLATLDAAVNRLRSNSAFSGLQGCEVVLPEVEPWPDPVDGRSVLDQIATVFRRFLVLPEGAADVLALFCAHTHCFYLFTCSPRLNIQSPEKGCGKTTLRDVIALFVPKPLLTENMTVAVLFRDCCGSQPDNSRR